MEYDPFCIAAGPIGHGGVAPLWIEGVFSLDTLDHYNFENINILLVEDNPHMRRIVRTILNSFGVKNIIEAGDAPTGLRLAQESDIDLIICTWLTDIMEGPEFVRKIRSEETSKNPYVPIIMVSSFTEKFRVTEARDAGVNEFLAKPVSPKSLHQRIVTIIEKPRPFVRTESYFGPCRRRQKLGPPHGCPERRRADPRPAAAQPDKLRDAS